MRIKLPGLVGLLFSSIVFSADQAEYEQFFDEYQRLSSEFDVTLNKLYAPDAKIMGVRQKPDGTEESMTIDGAQWKTIIIGSMERAEQTGDASEYSEVVFDVSEDSAKIKATRYSALHCFTDKRFYIIVKNAANEELQIVEQFMETPVKSSCENAETDLPEFLETTVKMINEQLPAAIDAETQLIKTSSEGSKLTYHYVLVNYTSETLTANQVADKLGSMVVSQSCDSPNLRPILDQDGSISYIYRGSDAVEIAKFDIDRSACVN